MTNIVKKVNIPPILRFIADFAKENAIDSSAFNFLDGLFETLIQLPAKDQIESIKILNELDIDVDLDHLQDKTKFQLVKDYICIIKD